MNMSEEVTGVTLQVAEKAVSTAAQTASSILEHIARLLRELVVIQREKERAKGGKAADKPRGTDLTDIKSGRVEVKKLIASAKRTGDTLSVSEQGLNKEDVKAITQKAKKYGIPVAFTNTDGKDNIYANVRTSDLPIFKQICTECIKEKIAERPQTLGNFKCQAWEIPFLTAELNAHDLSAQFAQTADGEHLYLFEKADAKAIKIARDEFARKCDELNNDLRFQTDEKGFCVIQDQRTGKEISFDEIPQREILISQLERTFGYDAGKAEMAAAKFGEEILSGKDKQEFFSNSAQKDFSDVVANIELESDNILTKPYTCWQLTAKADQVQRIVFRNNETGEFAVLQPNRQTRKQMREVLEEQLGITDRQELDALADKAERVNAYYLGTKKELYTQTTRLHKADFDFSDTQTASGMRRTDEKGTVLTKQQPLDEVENMIERKGQDSFSVTAFFVATEFDDQNNSYPADHSEQITLSLTDKKKSLAELTALYKKQGVPDAAAQQMAKEVFRKASMQSVEKIVQIEEVKESQITVSHGAQTATIPTANKQEAIAAVAKECGVPEDAAEVIVEKADEIKQAAQEPEMLDDTAQQADIQAELNGHEHHPEGDMLAGMQSEKPATPKLADAAKIDGAADPALPKTDALLPPDSPSMPPPPSMGARR